MGALVFQRGDQLRQRTVLGDHVIAGQRIEPGMDLLTVTDLSQVWVIAQIYEAETSAARVGRAARVTLRPPPRPDRKLPPLSVMLPLSGS